MHTVRFKKALVTWMRPNIKSMRVAANKNGPRKLKSAPLFTAQNVYRVKATTTVAVRITARRTLFPVGTKVIHTSDYHMTNQNSKEMQLDSNVRLNTIKDSQSNTQPKPATQNKLVMNTDCLNRIFNCLMCYQCKQISCD